MTSHLFDRRQFNRTVLGAAAASTLPTCLADRALVADEPTFKFRYIVGSSMYGYTDVAEIMPEVAKAGATAIDIWPKVHGNQREQLDELGEEKVAALLEQHDISLGCITQYVLGPFGLQDEMRLAKRSDFFSEDNSLGPDNPTGFDPAGLPGWPPTPRRRPP